MNEKPMRKIILPDGWEEVPTMESTLNIPEGWEEIAEVENQNPFNEGYNNQVHPMDMAAIEEAKIKEAEPKTLMDKVKEYGSAFFGGAKDAADDLALPIVDSIQKGQDAVIKPFADTGVVKTIENVANIVTPVGEFDFASQYDTESEADKAIRRNGDLSLNAYNKANKLAKTGQSLVADDKEGIETHNQNLYNLFTDDFGFDDFGFGEDGKYYATKGEDIIQVNKNTLNEFISDAYGDKGEYTGAVLGAKKGYDKGKLFGTKGKIIGATLGGALGAGAGTMVDMLDSALETGEKLSPAQYADEIGKSAALDTAGGLVGTAVVKGGSKVIKALPIGEDKLAQKYVDNSTNINSAENIESAEIAKELGATDTKLTQLASEGNAQKAMSDMFENSKEMREAVLADHEKLTKNLYTEGNINNLQNNNAENVNDLMGGVIDEQVKGIDTVYKRVYGEVKDDIIDVLGDSPLKVPGAKTANLIKDKVKMLDIGENAAGEVVSKSKKELDETYAGILDIAKSAFIDTEGEYINKFKISKMMDLNKQINQYAQLHKDKLTPAHFKVLKEIRTAIDDDITNYANVTLDSKNAQLVKDKWKEINGGYSEWLLGVSKDGNKIDNLLKDNMNIKTLATDMVNGGTIKNEYLETFGDIALHLRKTNPNALADLQDTVVNAILKPITVKQKFGGKTYEFIDFDMFEKMFDENTISTKGLNKIFTTSKEGAKKLDTLKAFRKLAKDEGALQKAIYKNESPLSEAAQKATETKRSFLFGVKYFFTRTLVNAMASRLIPSVAFDKMVIDLASKQRYTLKDMDKTIRKIELSPEYKSFTPDEKVALKKLRTDAEQNQKFMEEQAAKRKQEESIQTEKELFEQLKKDADGRIKANMLIENNYIIPKAQIQEGAKSPLGLDIQDRVSQVNTKQPSTKTVETKPTTFDEYIQKAGMDKQEVISKVELDNKFEELKKSPYYDEVVFNAENTYAKDARNKTIKEGDVRYEKEEFYGQGNENGYNKIDASYTPNEKYGTVLTKSDFNKIQANKIDEELVQKIEIEIAEREHADMISQQEFNKEFNEAEAAGKIPFSNPVVGGATVGTGDAIVNQRDYNKDGKVDERDIAIGAIIGAIGLKAAMKQFPDLFKIVEK